MSARREALVDALARAVDLLDRMESDSLSVGGIGDDAVVDSEYDDCLRFCRAVLSADALSYRCGGPR